MFIFDGSGGLEIELLQDFINDSFDVNVVLVRKGKKIQIFGENLEKIDSKFRFGSNSISIINPASKPTATQPQKPFEKNSTHPSPKKNQQNNQQQNESNTPKRITKKQTTVVEEEEEDIKFPFSYTTVAKFVVSHITKKHGCALRIERPYILIPAASKRLIPEITQCFADAKSHTFDALWFTSLEEANRFDASFKQFTNNLKSNTINDNSEESESNGNNNNTTINDDCCDDEKKNIVKFLILSSVLNSKPQWNCTLVAINSEFSKYKSKIDRWVEDQKAEYQYIVTNINPTNDKNRNLPPPPSSNNNNRSSNVQNNNKKGNNSSSLRSNSSNSNSSSSSSSIQSSNAIRDSGDCNITTDYDYYLNMDDDNGDDNNKRDDRRHHHNNCNNDDKKSDYKQNDRKYDNGNQRYNSKVDQSDVNSRYTNPNFNNNNNHPPSRYQTTNNNTSHNKKSYNNNNNFNNNRNENNKFDNKNNNKNNNSNPKNMGNNSVTTTSFKNTKNINNNNDYNNYSKKILKNNNNNNKHENNNNNNGTNNNKNSNQKKNDQQKPEIISKEYIFPSAEIFNYIKFTSTRLENTLFSEVINRFNLQYSFILPMSLHVQGLPNNISQCFPILDSYCQSIKTKLVEFTVEDNVDLPLLRQSTSSPTKHPLYFYIISYYNNNNNNNLISNNDDNNSDDNNNDGRSGIEGNWRINKSLSPSSSSSSSSSSSATREVRNANKLVRSVIFVYENDKKYAEVINNLKLRTSVVTFHSPICYQKVKSFVLRDLSSFNSHHRFAFVFFDDEHNSVHIKATNDVINHPSLPPQKIFHDLRLSLSRQSASRSIEFVSKAMKYMQFSQSLIDNTGRKEFAQQILQSASTHSVKLKTQGDTLVIYGANDDDVDAAFLEIKKLFDEAEVRLQRHDLFIPSYLISVLKKNNWRLASDIFTRFSLYLRLEEEEKNNGSESGSGNSGSINSSDDDNSENSKITKSSSLFNLTKKWEVKMTGKWERAFDDRQIEFLEAAYLKWYNDHNDGNGDNGDDDDDDDNDGDNVTIIFQSEKFTVNFSTTQMNDNEEGDDNNNGDINNTNDGNDDDDRHFIVDPRGSKFYIRRVDEKSLSSEFDIGDQFSSSLLSSSSSSLSSSSPPSSPILSSHSPSSLKSSNLRSYAVVSIYGFIPEIEEWKKVEELLFRHVVEEEIVVTGNAKRHISSLLSLVKKYDVEVYLETHRDGDDDDNGGNEDISDEWHYLDIDGDWVMQKLNVNVDDIMFITLKFRGLANIVEKAKVVLSFEISKLNKTKS